MAPALEPSALVVPEEASKGNVVPNSTLVVSEAERDLVAQMREALQAEGVATDGVRDLDLARFLRARVQCVPKAVRMFADDAKWRQEYLGAGVPVSEVECEVKANKAYIVSKGDHQPWVFLYAKNHDSTTRDMETFRKFSVFLLEKVIEKGKPLGAEQFGCVLDLGSAQYNNLDGRGMVAIFATLAAHYPERMQVLYLIHVPYIFWGVWRVVKSFIDPRITKKIVFLEDSELQKVFSEKIPTAVLPEEYGGEAELEGLWEMCGN